MKIPKHAKRVFKGVIHDVYQWDQELFDGSTQTFEAIRRPYTVQIVPVIGKKLFLSFEKQPLKSQTYTFFGGRGDKGEKPIQTAKRELLEETGFVSSDWELIREFQLGFKTEWRSYFYVARDCKKQAGQKLDAGEQIQVTEVDFDQFLRIVTSEGFWSSQIGCYILRTSLNKKKLSSLKKKLFGR